MDPIAIVKVIYETAALIKQTVDNVKVNQEQCKRLGERIDAISDSLRSTNDRDLQRPELKKSLDNFCNCVRQCLDFVTQFSDEKWYKKIFKTQNHKEQFDKMNLQLSQCATDLNLGINLEQMFDRKLDENDQNVDLNNIESKIDEMTTMMKKNDEEQDRRFKAMEENSRRHHNSIKSLIVECNKKSGDPARASTIEGEKNAYRQIPYNDLIKGERIGQGGFADVYRGKWLSHDHEVAIKFIQIERNNATAITKKVAIDSSRIPSSYEYKRNLPKSNEKENRAVISFNLTFKQLDLVALEHSVEKSDREKSRVLEDRGPIYQRLLDIKEIGASTENWVLIVSGKGIMPSPISKRHLKNQNL
ncbi:unnamed protein product [Rotaria magnacalcarata]|uniref:Protein kinase domain-containing protein n=1 Tax=Rotaria magnacalcarata TaxID=392030 RepID=A0A8S2KT26_9BILA|nr:unnamed protein product [Rotaria magnacalcarata]